MLTEIMRMIAELKKSTGYPTDIDTPLKKALFDNLERNSILALVIYETVKNKHYPNWRELPQRKLALMKAISRESGLVGLDLDRVMTIVSANEEF